MNLDHTNESCHSRNISAPHLFYKYGSKGGPHGAEIAVQPTVVGMDSREKKKAKPTPADIEAARRLRAIWKAMPDRPNQEAIALEWKSKEYPEGVSQGTISQYLNGKIPLGYHALLIFAKAFNVKPEQIRDDLPEQRKQIADREWPFTLFDRDRFEVLEEKERWIVEYDTLKTIEKLEQTKTVRKPDKPAGGRRVLQRR